MLIAEINGKAIEEARNSEDYLTSAVFGHVRLIFSVHFWRAFLSRAHGVEAISPSLLEVIEGRHGYLESIEHVSTIFWPHFGLDEPDLLVTLHTNLGSSSFLVEAKLNAGKSGKGDEDQLARYLKHVALSQDGLLGVVYLTPRDATTELLETLSVVKDLPSSSEKLFALTWQDIHLASCLAIGHAQSLEFILLDELSRFLARRDLVHFAGMVVNSALPMFPVVSLLPQAFLTRHDLQDFQLRTLWNAL